MLSRNSYPKAYVAACRSKVSSQVAAYKAMVASAKDQGAITAFEPVFFNNMVLVLDAYFVHRSRTLELKDGNALNEVRVLCDSMLSNGNKLGADKTIKLDPAKSVLKYRVGDEIRLDEKSFLRLSKAFFTEIERKYP